MASRVAVRYTGRVQGVGFRATACDLARGGSVVGFVRNEPDGAVSLEAQGDREAIDAFLDRIEAVMGSNIAQAERAPVPMRTGDDAFVIR